MSWPSALRVQAKRKPPVADQHVLTALLQEALEATAQHNEATREFDAFMGQLTSGLRQRDGAQRIKNASSNLSISRNEKMKAQKRINGFRVSGIVPDDLKQGSGG